MIISDKELGESEMGFRIDKTWLNFLNPIQPVRKKDAAENSVSSINDSTGKNNQNNNPNQNQDQKQEEPNREELERALNEMKSSPNFTGKGINAEIIDTVNGLTVRLNQANGSTIKTMTADEFMRLRRSSVLEDVGRGNILDQKF